MPRRTQDFQTIRSEGGLLPSDLLRRVITPTEKLDGTGPQDYGLPAGERLNEVITQSWNRLRKHWAEFRTAAAGLPDGEAGTGLTNDKWSLPLLRELGFGPLPSTAGPELGGRTYAISRFCGPVPVHLVGCGLSLDRRKAGTAGASAASPHGLVQEFLNRSPAHLWAIVTNGLTWRVLRDNQALSRQSYLEFDLEAMLDGEVYSDFVLLWLMSHATRFEPRESDRPETCWLEQWTRVAVEQGTRALGDLRTGVGDALQVLGQGFTSHPRNAALRESLRSGQLSAADLHGQLLRVVYRLIFLFVAEDRSIDGRPLLHPPDDSKDARTARERYAAYYSTARLREMAGKIKGSRHGDLWRQLQSLIGALSGEASFAVVRDHLALPALGSFLWSQASTGDLNGAGLSNHDLLEAVRNLAFTRQGKVLRPVDYKNLGAEELGGVYEGLLALTPQISADGAHFTFAEFAGNERKISGSYYTPDSLVQCLLDSALDPVVEGAIKGKTGSEAEKALLALKVCDPAVGSGHFLVGAAHRMARHLARVRAQAHGESEPSPIHYQNALRDVIGRCLYGVDINPMAAELCRVSLWLEALEPGKPLSFLDHHIRVGNSLLGATPELIAGGLPDDAYNPIEGDEKKACAYLRKRNRAERRTLGPLFEAQDAADQLILQEAASALDQLPDERPEDVRAKEREFHRQVRTDAYRQKKLLADAWCAAFVIRKYLAEPGRESSATGITQAQLSSVARGQQLQHGLLVEAEILAAQHQFFHWHLAFPEVFSNGGFSCILGNPPWEKLQTEELQFFAARNPSIAALVGAERKHAIAALKTTDPLLASQWESQRRHDGGLVAFVRNSGRYRLTGLGKFNTFALFSELGLSLIKEGGRFGCVVPSGIATDDTTKAFFGSIVASESLVSLFDFENREGIFDGVHRSFKFCLLTLGRQGTEAVAPATFVFFAQSVSDITDPDKRFTLSAPDFLLLNPNTLTCPIFRSKRDAVLTKAVYRRHPIFLREDDVSENNYAPRVWRLLNTTDDSEWFVKAADAASTSRLVPVVEAKTLHQFDHRYGTFVPSGGSGEVCETPESAKSDPEMKVLARYYVSEETFLARLPVELHDKGWFMTVRNIARSTDERTCIAAIFPRGASCEHTPYIEVRGDSAASGLLVGAFNSFVFDYVTRQKVGGTHISYFILYQLPVLVQATLALSCGWHGDETYMSWLWVRILELTYTSWDIAAFASDGGFASPPLRWDRARRRILRCELDAAYCHLYLPSDQDGDWMTADGESAEELAALREEFPRPRDAVAFILDTFPIVRRKDEEHGGGEYSTKNLILEMYDEMQESMRSGQPYRTRLDPPPADPRCRHPDRPIATTA